MNSHQMRTLAGGFVAALVLTALFLLVEKTPVVVAGYLFSLLAVIVFFGTVYYVAGGGGGNSYLTNAAFPLAVRSYVIVNITFSLVVGAAEYFRICSMPTKWFVFIHIIFAALLIWRLLAMRSGQEEIERVEQKVKESTFSWRSMRADAEAIRLRAEGTFLKDVSGVCDAFRYADPVESPALAGLDGEIRENLIRLGQLVDARDAENIANLCVMLQRQIKERGVRLKMLK